MKINDLFESELDEGPVGNFLAKGARGLAKGAGAVAGGIAGMGSAAKQGYQAGKAAVGVPNTAPTASGSAPAVPSGSAPVATQAPQVRQATQDAPQQAQPYAGPNWDEVTGEPLSPKAKAEYAQFSPEQKAEIEQNIANQKQPAAPAAETPAAAPAAAETPAAPTKQSADQIATTIKSIYSNPENNIGAPAAKQEIIALAKAAGMSGMKIESKVFHSRFLGIDI